MNSLNRPNDERAFVHKFILGVAGKVLPGPLGIGARALSRAVSGRPGGQSFGTPQGAGPRPIPGLGGLIERVVPGGSSGFFPQLPESGPMQQNRAVGIAPQDQARALLQGGNGACPAPVLGGNRRINAAGQQACPGFHWNESTYTRLGGPCSSKPAGTVLKGTEQVKNRRKFNTANGPARKRAIARLKASEGDCKDALRAVGYRTISKQSSREMRMRRTRHR